MRDKKNLLAVLNGKMPAHTPIWLMRQAGRYLPEYRALRAQAGSFMKLCFTPELAAEVTLQPVKRFGMDGTILFSDILVVPYGLGLQLDFIEGEGPKLETVTQTPPVFSREVFFARTQNIFETVRLVKAGMPETSTLIGFAGAPWTVACYMLGGKGADEFAVARAKAAENPAFFETILETLVEATGFYLSEQVKAGAEVLQLFDSWSGLVPDALFARWVIEPTKAIVARVKKEHPATPIIGFPRMAGDHIAAYVRETGIDAVSLDQTINLATAQKNLPVIVQGNLDPSLMEGETGPMLESAKIILDAMEKPFIFNLGHGLTPKVPPENVAALTAFVQGYRQ